MTVADAVVTFATVVVAFFVVAVDENIEYFEVAVSLLVDGADLSRVNDTGVLEVNGTGTGSHTGKLEVNGCWRELLTYFWLISIANVEDRDSHKEDRRMIVNIMLFLALSVKPVGGKGKFTDEPTADELGCWANTCRFS